jgi:hypothetical protein
MPRLPNPQLATIDAAKITAYLLNGSNPVGRAKAAFFSRFALIRQLGRSCVMLCSSMPDALGSSALATSNSGQSIRWRVRCPRRMAGNRKFAQSGSSERAKRRRAS